LAELKEKNREKELRETAEARRKEKVLPPFHAHGDC